MSRSRSPRDDRPFRTFEELCALSTTANADWTVFQHRYANPIRKRRSFTRSKVTKEGKYCTACSRVLPLEKFGRDGERIKPSCRECIANHDKYYATTPLGIFVRFRLRLKDVDRRCGKEYGFSPEQMMVQLSTQHGLCAISGLPMSFKVPGCLGQLSIERIDNSLGHIDGNCCFVLNWLQSGDTSRADSSGGCQWTKEKFKNAPELRARPVNLEVLSRQIEAARRAPERDRTKWMGKRRKPDEQGRRFCNGECGQWLPPDEFHKASSKFGCTSICKSCHNVRQNEKKKGCLRLTLQRLYGKAKDRANLRGQPFDLDLDVVLDLLL